MRSSRLSLPALVIATSLLAASLLQAQTPAQLRVVVADETSGTPLVGVQVSIRGTPRGGVTDAQGRLTITGIPTGDREVVVQHLGYRTERILIHFDPGAEVEADLLLRLEPVALPGVEARVRPRDQRFGASGFEQRRRSGIGTFLDESEIDRRRRRTARVVDLLAGVQGLSLERTRGGGARIYATRGVDSILGGRCGMSVFINGMALHGAERGIDLDEVISSADIRAIEVYSSNLSAPIQFAGGCGALVIWTY